MLKEKIQIIEDAENWEEAIKISAKPLLDNNNIEYRYVDSIINNIYKYGAYIVLVDGTAMAHSRPEDGVIKMGMSFLKIKNGIDFYKTENKVYLFFTLAAEDSSSHQDAMSELADILGNDNLVKKIIQEDLTEEEILNLFN